MDDEYYYLPNQVMDKLSSDLTLRDIYRNRNLSSYWRKKYEDSLVEYTQPATPALLQDMYKNIDMSPVIIIDLVKKYGFQSLDNYKPYLSNIIFGRDRKMKTKEASRKKILRAILSLDDGLKYLSSYLDKMQYVDLINNLDNALERGELDLIVMNWLSYGGMETLVNFATQERRVDKDDYDLYRLLLELIQKYEIMPNTVDMERLQLVLPAKIEKQYENAQELYDLLFHPSA